MDPPQDCGVQGAKPSVAVLALAGVVMNNQCRFTNLDWCISGHELSSTLKIPKVELINDFVAQGYGMLTLGDDEAPLRMLGGQRAHCGCRESLRDARSWTCLADVTPELIRLTCH